MLAIIPAVAMAASAALLSAAPAHAAASDCGAGAFCVFKSTNYFVDWRVFSIPAASGCINLTDFNDTASSAINRSGKTVRLYQDYNKGGKYVIVAPGQSIPDLTSVPIYNNNGSYFGVNTFNDRTSSICW
jgi:hypothetical protein